MNKKIIVAAVALALTGIQAEAAKNKDKYKDVVVYGNITLEQDSMNEWGPWEQFIQPAAGAPVPPPVAAVTEDPIPEIREPVIPEEPEVITEGPCEAGSRCNFATYQYNYYNYNGGYGGDGGEGGPVAASIDLDLNINNDGYGGSVTASYSITAKHAHENYPQVDSTEMSEDHVHDYGDVIYFHAEGSEPGEEEGATHHSYINGDTAPEITGDFVAGYWSDGAEGYDNYNSYSNRWGYYIDGTTSTIEDMEALNAGNVIAQYVGYTMNYGTETIIDVNFGDSTFAASVNGGSDGYTYTMTDENGVTHVMGDVGYNASGYISGANIVADNLSKVDGTVSGTMVGAFFGGSDAGILAGQHELTVTGDGYTNASHVDNFVTEDLEKTGGILNIFDD